MKLFESWRLRDLQFKNRIGVSPMCQYSAKDGHVGQWHLVHLGSRAIGGAALVMAEATGVQAVGRISPTDTGIYLDSHVDAWKPIAQFIREHGAIAGIQLAHAGRKGSTTAPWNGGKAITPSDGGWQPVAPSAVPFAPDYPMPKELTVAEIDQIVADFVTAAKRAQRAGFQVVELHAAHGYLLHEFYSPLSNFREGEYGGSFENRIRLAVRVAKEIRSVWPADWPMFVRISATDWKEGGWDLPQSIELSRKLKDVGVDLIDVSSGGNVADAQIPVGPGYQVRFAEAIRQGAQAATATVGMVTDAVQAETILNTGQADMVFLAREMLRDPYWPRRAAAALGGKIKPPVQYERAW
jgi:2,4-dienoyl-CoA reductase-like NADH-dependent reductase (Old Yellow Enzyme family)